MPQPQPSPVLIVARRAHVLLSAQKPKPPHQIQRKGTRAAFDIVVFAAPAPAVQAVRAAVAQATKEVGGGRVVLMESHPAPGVRGGWFIAIIPAPAKKAAPLGSLSSKLRWLSILAFGVPLALIGIPLLLGVVGSAGSGYLAYKGVKKLSTTPGGRQLLRTGVTAAAGTLIPGAGGAAAAILAPALIPEPKAAPVAAALSALFVHPVALDFERAIYRQG
jgi:hypothetical protein